jgi:hypothetical protein
MTVCTMIAEKIEISGSAKGQQEWFVADHAYVSYDHPFHAQLEHALNIDFVNESIGPGARVAIELTRDSAERLVAAIQSALARSPE